jgi:hypothetical protein
MSHDYDTSTYAADLAGMPSSIDSPDSLSPVANAAFTQQRTAPDKLVYVHGSTRSGWAIYVAKSLIQAANLPSLRFLTGEGGQRFETEHGYCCVSVLAGANLAAAVSELRRLLEFVKEDPMRAMDADVGGCLDGTAAVIKALSRDYVSSRPASDYGNVSGDDGQGEDYLFTWLRSVLRVAEGALSDGRAFVHELTV